MSNDNVMRDEFRELREHMNRGFEESKRRFEESDRRFDAMMTFMLARFEQMDRRFDEMAQQATQRHAELLAELGQHTRAAAEANRADLRVVDDQYRDLPPRVTKLEETVFAPKPKKRAQRR